MSGCYRKRYPDPRGRQRALANYTWLAGLGPAVLLPRLLPAPDSGHLAFEHVNGRHARPGDLPLLAASLGVMHGTAYAKELHLARLPERHRTRDGRTLPGFPDGRIDAAARELRSGRLPDARLAVHEAQELIMNADGPAAFYKETLPYRDCRNPLQSRAFSISSIKLGFRLKPLHVAATTWPWTPASLHYAR